MKITIKDHEIKITHKRKIRWEQTNTKFCGKNRKYVGYNHNDVFCIYGENEKRIFGTFHKSRDMSGKGSEKNVKKCHVISEIISNFG